MTPTTALSSHILKVILGKIREIKLYLELPHT